MATKPEAMNVMIDLLLVGRKSHEVSLREAAIWSGIWVSLAFLFSLFLRD